MKKHHSYKKKRVFGEENLTFSDLHVHLFRKLFGLQAILLQGPCSSVIFVPVQETGFIFCEKFANVCTIDHPARWTDKK